MPSKHTSALKKPGEQTLKTFENSEHQVTNFALVLIHHQNI